MPQNTAMLTLSLHREECCHKTHPVTYQISCSSQILIPGLIPVNNLRNHLSSNEYFTTQYKLPHSDMHAIQQSTLPNYRLPAKKDHLMNPTIGVDFTVTYQQFHPFVMEDIYLKSSEQD
ncbi:hypothetical protein GQX74_008420 [Glossina fuscipes]|nr:hypothetical protein GQX74_008420 [Glossina fuscipes]